MCRFDEYLDMWGSNRCIEEEIEDKEKERETSHQDALGTPVQPVSGSHNRKSCFHNTAQPLPAPLSSCSPPILLPSKTTDRITGRGHTSSARCTQCVHFIA